MTPMLTATSIFKRAALASAVAAGVTGLVALIGEYGHRQITHAYRNDFQDDPARWGLGPAEELDLMTRDGIRLRAWLFGSPDAVGSVIVGLIEDSARLHRDDSRSESRRDVVPHGGRDQNLFEVFDRIRQAFATGLVEFGEHVVQDHHRISSTRLPPQNGGGCEFERKRERPGLPVARVTACRKAVEGEDQVVSVRTDERDPAVELRATDVLERGTEGIGDLFDCEAVATE